MFLTFQAQVDFDHCIAQGTVLVFRLLSDLPGGVPLKTYNGFLNEKVIYNSQVMLTGLELSVWGSCGCNIKQCRFGC